ncbi:MAG: CHAT domain-containing protein [Microbacterium sp.]|uniref:CHAT domain-containing protein n=1 Tax=Microbacterium sp. TaxID=51671 RepID=UPI003F9D8203
MDTSAHALYERGRDAANAQRYDHARKLLAQAAATADDSDLGARIDGTTAYLLAQTGEPARAVALCQAALTRPGVSAETQAILSGQLGVLFTRAGRLDEAEHMLTRAIDGLDSVAKANCLLNRSVVHMQRRTLDACTADLEQATALYEAADDRAAAAEARHNLGYTALLQGDLVAALELMEQSREVIAADSDVSAAMSDLDRAEVLRDAGLVDEAERLLEAVAVTFGAVRMRQARGEAEFHLARSLLRHDPARAAQVARAAARRFRALGSASWAARSDAIRLDARLATGKTPPTAEFAATADALKSAGFPTEATAVRFSGAIAETRRGVHSSTASASGVRPNPANPRQSHPSAAPRLPRDAPTPLRLRAAEFRATRAAAQGQSASARKHASDGLELLANWQRSFGALDLQASLAMHGTNLVLQGLSSAAAEGDPSILFDWSERARHLSQQVAPVRPPHDPALAADLSELRMLRAELTGSEWTTHPQVRSLRDRVRERQWTATSAGDTRPRIPLDQLRAQLDAAGSPTASLSYVFTGEQLLCVVATAEASRIVSLSWTAVQAAADGLRADLDVSASIRRGPMAQVVARALDERMLRLNDALLAPVCAGLHPGTRLLLTVPGALAEIPWGMLPDMASRPFTLATSISRWAHDRGTTDRPGRVPRRAGFAAGPRVPRGVEETSVAASVWAEASVLTGHDATVDAVTALADSVDVLHIAAHGRHAVDNPLFAGFELADGTLFGYDVDLIPRVPATVVLSACELGRSSVRWGEEALGMTRVWLHAGADCVIAAPVVVADDVASELLSAVHSGLSRGDAPAVALAAASEATGHRTPFHCHGSGF